MKYVLILLAVAMLFSIACSRPAATVHDDNTSKSQVTATTDDSSANVRNQSADKADPSIAAAVRADDYDRAIAEARAALNANPSGALREKLADAYLARGWYYKARRLNPYTLTDLRSAEEAAPAYYRVYYDLGRFYNNQMMQSTGVFELNKCIKLKPDFAPAYNERSACESRIYIWEAALSDANMAVKLDPQEPVYYYTRSLAYRGLGRNQEAVADLETVLKLSQDAALKEKASADLKALKQ